jgi:hypothetical protein
VDNILTLQGYQILIFIVFKTMKNTSLILLMLVKGNVFLEGAKSWFAESGEAVFPEYNPAINLITENGNV